MLNNCLHAFKQDHTPVANFSVKDTGTAFPSSRVAMLRIGENQKVSENVWSLASSRIVKYRTDPLTLRIKLSPPATPCVPALIVFDGSSHGEPVWPYSSGHRELGRAVIQNALRSGRAGEQGRPVQLAIELFLF